MRVNIVCLKELGGVTFLVVSLLLITFALGEKGMKLTDKEKAFMIIGWLEGFNSTIFKMYAVQEQEILQEYKEKINELRQAVENISNRVMSVPTIPTTLDPYKPYTTWVDSSKNNTKV